MSNSIHLVRPGWADDPENLHEWAVDSLRRGPHYIQVALELWRLSGHEEQAKKIRAVLDRAYERECPVLITEDLKEFSLLLEGLEEALRRTIVDSKFLIRLELLPELRLRAQAIDLEDGPQHSAATAVSEGMSQVHALLLFLERALEQGLHLSLD